MRTENSCRCYHRIHSNIVPTRGHPFNNLIVVRQTHDKHRRANSAQQPIIEPASSPEAASRRIKRSPGNHHNLEFAQCRLFPSLIRRRLGNPISPHHQPFAHPPQPPGLKLTLLPVHPRNRHPHPSANHRVHQRPRVKFAPHIGLAAGTPDRYVEQHCIRNRKLGQTIESFARPETFSPQFPDIACRQPTAGLTSKLRFVRLQIVHVVSQELARLCRRSLRISSSRADIAASAPINVGR